MTSCRTLVVCRYWNATQDRRQDLAARVQIPERGPKIQKGATFPKYCIMVACSNQGARHEMGGTDYKCGSRAPLAPTLATVLMPWLNCITSCMNVRLLTVVMKRS